MSKRRKARIITHTSSKVMILMGELVNVLNKTEIQQFHHILDKIRVYDEKQVERGMD